MMLFQVLPRTLRNGSGDAPPHEIIEAADRAMAEFRPLKEQLDYKVLQAYGIFEEVAGPLDEAVGKPGGAWELIAHKLRRIW
jgi:hypothetical protein